MRIQLTRKLADNLDGIDVSTYREGDSFDLPTGAAEMLIAERWAVPSCEPMATDHRFVSASCDGMVAADDEARGSRTLDQLRRAREEMDAHRSQQQEQQRAEDEIREELRDSRARTVTPSE